LPSGQAALVGELGVWRDKKKSRNGLPRGPKSREETPNEGTPDIGQSLQCNKSFGGMLLCSNRMAGRRKSQESPAARGSITLRDG